MTQMCFLFFSCLRGLLWLKWLVCIMFRDLLLSRGGVVIPLIVILYYQEVEL
jgi:hypothetical protein